MPTIQRFTEFVRDYYNTNDTVPLHAPNFYGRESEYVLEAINSTYVSSNGYYVDQFENAIADFTSSKKVVAVVNGTAALHIALKLVGVTNGDFVITQPLTFVATCNAINYCGADPIFVDVDKKNLGLSPVALEKWLNENTKLDSDGLCRVKKIDRVVRACVPVHTFGHPVDIDGLEQVCKRWNLTVVEDAAESLGSYYKGRHTGTFGSISAVSFNGNKIITTGGGGAILVDDVNLGAKAKHIATTAKAPHPYEYFHDQVGYNYRLPNLNSALGCAQMEFLSDKLESKRRLASFYKDLFENSDYYFLTEPEGSRSNYWLNAIICEDKKNQQHFIKLTNECGINTRPIWTLMHNLPMYSNCFRGDLTNAEWLEKRVVNIPSSSIK
jgi:aminotransferase in exopolysaccharide biosynthesis